MNWVELAEAGSVKALEAELSPDTRIGTFMGLSLHILKGWEKPACMAEIGRIREREFRAAGAGRNLPSDIDSLDITPGSYLQLVAWDPDNREIVSMYRFAVAADILARFGPEGLRTSSLFIFSDHFQKELLPRSIELGRSVVNRKAGRAIAGLFAVWCGLGILICEHSELEFYFGNVTLTNAITPPSRDALVLFLTRLYSSPDERAMVKARPGMEYDYSYPEQHFSSNSAVARRELIDLFSRRNESVPPIILSYLGAAESFSIFDTARDGDFGNAWEIAIAIPFKKINRKTRRRFLDGYKRAAGGYFDT